MLRWNPGVFPTTPDSTSPREPAVTLVFRTLASTAFSLAGLPSLLCPSVCASPLSMDSSSLLCLSAPVSASLFLYPFLSVSLLHFHFTSNPVCV